MQYLLTFLLFTTYLFSNDILTINQDKEPYTIGTHIHYFADETDSLSIEEVSKKEFTPYEKDIPNFGFLAPTYWFKIQFDYTSEMQEKEWYLNIDYPILDYVDFFMFDKKGGLITHEKRGDLYLPSTANEKSDNLLFALPTHSLKTYTLYLRVQTTGSMFVPMHIMSSSEVFKNTYKNQTLSGMYYGILLILALYNLIIFLYTREKIYILYVTFVSSYALWQLSFDGLGLLYLWENNYWLKEKGTALFIYTSTLTLILFSQSLLKSEINIPLFHKYLLNLLKYLSIMGIIATLFFPYKYTIILAALLALITPVMLLIGGIMALKKDYYSIRLFVVGWVIFLVGTILFALSKFNIVGGYVIMKYAQQIASAIDMILLSIALAERFKRLQYEYTLKLKNHNNDLKKEVALALKKKRQKDQLLLRQSRLASMGEMIEQIAHQWRQPLNNIGLLNQDLYFKKQLGTLEDSLFEKVHTQIDENLTYMSGTIDDFRTYYRGGKTSEFYYLDDSISTILSIIEATTKDYKIEIKTTMKEGVQVNNIKNELFQVILIIISNAKDALVSKNIKNKVIHIKIDSDAKYAYLEISDNAKGISKDILLKIFDPYFTTKYKDGGTGIGLYMAQTIIEKNMSGKLSVENRSEGACFRIQLPLAEPEKK